MKVKWWILSLLCTAFLIGTVNPSQAQTRRYNCFLKIEGMRGESVDSHYKDWIDVLSFSWGQSASGTLTSGRTAMGGTAQRITAPVFSFSCLTNLASPGLFKAFATGLHIKEVILAVSLPNSPPTAVAHTTYKLSDVTVISYQTVYDFGKDNPPRDEVSLSYGKVEFEYRPIRADGK